MAITKLTLVKKLSQIQQDDGEPESQGSETDQHAEVEDHSSKAKSPKVKVHIEQAGTLGSEEQLEGLHEKLQVLMREEEKMQVELASLRGELHIVHKYNQEHRTLDKYITLQF